MSRLQLAIVGFGALGRACADAAAEVPEVAVAGVVRRAGASAGPLPRPFDRLAAVDHVSALGRVDAALVCVPTDAVLGVACELLQRRVPVVECASLSGDAFERHRREIDRVAAHHRVAAVVGAGWQPGVLDRLGALFALLIPHGHTTTTPRPGASLHHTATAERVPGVVAALCAEHRGTEGIERYLYVELARGADPARVESLLRADPLFAGERTQVFPVPSIAELEDPGRGVLIERRAGAGRHDTLLLEARFDPARFAARLMVDAAQALSGLPPGAHLYLPGLR